MKETYIVLKDGMMKSLKMIPTDVPYPSVTPNVNMASAQALIFVHVKWDGKIFQRCDDQFIQ